MLGSRSLKVNIDMKQGDKVWFYDPIDQAPACGECLEVYNGFQGISVVVKYKEFPPICLKGNEVFETEEELNKRLNG